MLSITKTTIKLIIYYQICNYWHQEKILNIIKSLNISDLKHGKLKQSILQPIKSHSMWVCHLQAKICWFTLLAFMIFEQEKSRLHIASRRIRNFRIITHFLNLLRAPRYWAHHHILTTWPKLVLTYNLFWWYIWSFRFSGIQLVQPAISLVHRSSPLSRHFWDLSTYRWSDFYIESRQLEYTPLSSLVCAPLLNTFFYSLFVFLLALRARQNTAQLVKILSDTPQQNV